MKFIKKLTTEQKSKIKEAVIHQLERYRLLKGLELLESDQKTFCQRIEKAVHGLPEKERILITERYMMPGSEYVTDYETYNMLLDPPISAMTYHKIRGVAMVKIALYLNIDTGVEITI